MYQYTRSFLRPRGLNKTWIAVDISLVPMATLLAQYVDGYIVVTNPVISATPMYIQYRTLTQTTLPMVNLPLASWLAWIGNVALAYSSTEPTAVTGTVRYSDAVQARFQLRRIHPTTPWDPCSHDDHIPLSSLTDLSLHKDNVSLEELHQYVLCTVNGLLHRTILTDIGMQIEDGGSSVDICNAASVGVLSLREVGVVRQVPLTAANLKYKAGTPHRHIAYVETGLDLNNCTVMLSLGGYLHACDGVATIVSHDTGVVGLSLTRVDLARRILESSRYIDLSSIPITRSNIRTGAIVVDELDSNAVVDAYLQLSQTFLVVVSTSMLYVDYTALDTPTLPGVYTTVNEPQYPIRSSTGRLPEYWRRQEYSGWVLDSTQLYDHDYLYTTTPWSDGVINSDVEHDTWRYSRMHLMGIHTTHLTA